MDKFKILSATPESVGVASKDVIEFYKTLESCGFYTHSILMARGDKVFSTAYYKPFNEKFLHRVYSVSKSFVAVAIGLAYTEKLLSLSDKIIDYFPEFRNENIDEFYERCTILDMLKMQSNIGSNVYWWGKFDSRTKAYYSQKSIKSPNSIFWYDSIGSFVLGNIIKKLTGKNFLEYLKEKVLLDLGFSAESYVLTEPGGYAVGDSGVMCTLCDLFIFARLLAKRGYINGKQYIDKEFMDNAVSVQSKNDLYADYNSYDNGGYGYLIWITDNGFALAGLGGQYVFYNEKNDFTFVIQSDNQGASNADRVIYHELKNHFIPKINGSPIEENEKDFKALREFESERELIAQYGNKTSSVIEKINGVTYKSVIENSMNITELKFDFFDNGGRFSFVCNGIKNHIDFAFNKNIPIEFSFGKRPKEDMMGINVEGKYKCLSSAGFIDDNTLAIKVQVIDSYFGKMQITANFNNNELNVYIRKHGQYVFDDIGGYVVAKS